MYQLDAIQLDIHLPIKCYPVSHSCANYIISSWTFMCQLNIIQREIHVPIKRYPVGHSCYPVDTFMCQFNVIKLDFHVRDIHVPI